MWAEEGNLSWLERFLFTLLKVVALLSYFNGRSWAVRHEPGFAGAADVPRQLAPAGCDSGRNSNRSSDDEEAEGVLAPGPVLHAATAAVTSPAIQHPAVNSTDAGNLDTCHTAMLVAVVVPVYLRDANGERMLGRLLKQLWYHQDGYKPDKTVMVDDGSPVAVANAVDSILKLDEWTKSHTTVITLKENGGSAAARNVGIEFALQKCKADLICFTDLDCIPATDWIASCVDFQRRQQEKGYAHLTLQAGRTVSYNITFVDTFHNYYGTHNGRRIGKVGTKLLYGCSCNMAADRRVLQLLKFDAELSRCSYEDIEMCFRGLKQGIRIRYNPNMVVAHDYGYSAWNPVRNLMKLSRQFYRYGSGEHSMVERHPEFLAWFITSSIVSSFSVTSICDVKVAGKVKSGI